MLVDKSYYPQPSTLLSNCETIREAERVFSAAIKSGQIPGALDWTCLISIYAKQGKAWDAFRRFCDMKLAKVALNPHVYHALITVMLKTQQVAIARCFLQYAIEVDGMVPYFDITHQEYYFRFLRMMGKDHPECLTPRESSLLLRTYLQQGETHAAYTFFSQLKDPSVFEYFSLLNLLHKKDLPYLMVEVLMSPAAIKKNVYSQWIERLEEVTPVFKLVYKTMQLNRHEPTREAMAHLTGLRKVIVGPTHTIKLP